MEVSGVSERSRSLDVQSLYSEKSRFSGEKSRAEIGREEIRALKRKQRLSSPVKKRRKGRKEVPLSTFESVVSDSKNSSDAVGRSGLNSVPLKLSGFVLYGKNTTRKKNGLVLGNENVKNSSKLSSVSHGLGDSVVVIPKRPRGFFGRKKFRSDRVGKQVVSSRDRRLTSLGTGSSSKTSSEVQGNNLNGDLGPPVPPSSRKRKKIVDEFKENRSITANSDLPVNDKDGSGNLVPKKVNRNRRKRQKPTSEMQNCEVELPPVTNVVKVFEDLQEDDEENLEQNAARMLSSRFDPSCTGLSRNGTGSKAQSADDSLRPALFHREFNGSRTSASAESESASVDAAGRVLRPRKQHRHRGLLRRRRRHFYEVSSTDLDAYWVVNQKIKVFWPLDMSWYFGIVKDYDPVTKLHHIKYDDRDEEWINLQNERFKLLLHPGEVPGKFNSEKPGMRGEHVNENDVGGLDDSYTGNVMDSEPIISWLARSSLQLKSSPFGIAKKQKRSQAGKNVLHATLSDNPVETPKRCLDVDLARADTDELSIGSVMLERSVDGEMADKSVVNSSSCPNTGKLPLVYFRRRFHKGKLGLCQTSEERSVTGSVTLLASVADRVGSLEKNDIAFESSRIKNSKHSNQGSLLHLGEAISLSELCVSPMKLEVKLRLSLPLLQFLDLACGAERFWLHNVLLLLRYGTVMAAWPKVHLEMLFVDNAVGLRFLLFEGCLGQAAAFMCLILSVFQQPDECDWHDDLQLPVTSIRFQLSGLQDVGRQLVFVFYNFVELRSSQWLYLDNKLKRYCLVTKKLPLAECTYANIVILQNGIDNTPITSVHEDPVPFQKKSRQGIMHRDYSSCKFDENFGRLPPFVLSFAAAPSFFLGLHLKMLMKNNVASISFQNCSPMCLGEYPEKYLTMGGVDCSLVEDSAKQVLDPLDNTENSLSQDDSASRWLPCQHSKVDIDDFSEVRNVDWMKSSKNSALSVTGTAVGFQHSQKKQSFESVSQLDKRQCHSGSQGYDGRSWSSASEDLSSQDKSETSSLSCLNDAKIQTPPVGEADGQPFDKGALSTKLCTTDLPWSMNDCTIRSSNPTAPRSLWHRNRRSSFSSSFSYHSKTWPDGRADFLRNGFVNGSRKPRTQVSYLLPFGGYNFGSKPRSHQRKRDTYKRMKNDNAKRISDGWSPQIYPELLSCDANVLVTAGDKGWRECGAEIVLESADHQDWRLLVKISGTTRYAYKAHQFLQPGTTNRYTHAMMWKGGKDWMLEFSDRSQWALFKGMHEECHNRNIRAASVKNIPIPGVRLIEDSDDNAVDMPFIRTSLRYFRLVGTEVDMAMDPSRVLYDMESDDEDWISEFRSSGTNGRTQLLEISDEMFERTMDILEKVSYAQQRDDFSNDEIEFFMDGVGPVDVIRAIYKHWQQKRKRKGMPLIRQLQPPLWERYQQQLKDWELAMSRTNNYSNGCNERALAERPPMFAFCLRPRGLEVPNKGTKQRSHRKFTAIGHYGAFSRDQDAHQALVPGRKLNGFAAIGDEKALVTVQNHESLEISPRIQLSARSSPRDAAAVGNLSMSSDGSERNQYPKLQRNKSNKMGVYLVPTDSQVAETSYSQRTMGKKNGACRWNMGIPEWPTLRQYQPDVFQRQRVDQLGGTDFDEFRLRDASSAAQHASNMAKLKQEKAQRLMHKADFALHKAVSALMIAEAMRAAEEDLIGDG